MQYACVSTYFLTYSIIIMNQCNEEHYAYHEWVFFFFFASVGDNKDLWGFIICYWVMLTV